MLAAGRALAAACPRLAAAPGRAARCAVAWQKCAARGYGGGSSISISSRPSALEPAVAACWRSSGSVGQAARRPRAATAAAVASQQHACTAAAAAAQQQGQAGGAEQRQRQQRGAPGAGKQTVDYTALAACCSELVGAWVPSKVEEVVQPDKYTLALRLRTPLAQGWLHVSWHTTAARVCMGQPPARGDVSEAFSFADQASAHLKGLVLLSAALPFPWERVLRLDFGTRPGEPPSRQLFCEVMAKYSNAVLADGCGSILLCAHQVGSAMSSLRLVQQGRAYQPPPAVNGIPPQLDESLERWRDNVERAAALAAVERAAAAALSRHAAGKREGAPAGGAGAAPGAGVAAGAVRAYMGASPQLAEELCAAAGVAPSAPPAGLDGDAWRALHGAWRAWLRRLAAGDFEASSCPRTGRFSSLGAYEQRHGSMHDLLDHYYGGLQAGELYSSLHQRLSGAVRQALKKARGRALSFEQQLEAAAGAAEVQRRGDIIVANLYRIPEGAQQLEAEDWETGQPVVLELDAAKPPMEVAEGLYKRARKLRRAVDAVGPLLEGARREVEYLETVELELAQMPPGGAEQELAALREVQEELVESGVIRAPPEAALSARAAAKGRKAAKRQAKAAGGKALPPALAAAAAAGGAGLRQFRSPNGFLVLVGRNNKQNDVLSHQIAKPRDVWMHVRGLPGSHAVVRIEAGQGEPAQEDLQFAADLAAWFSKARDAGKADVIVARAGDLKKFKGAKPGQVLVTKEEGNVVARPGDSAAARAAAAGGGG